MVEMRKGRGNQETLIVKDINPEPVEPGHVHPELGCQVDSQGQGAVHGVVKERPEEEGGMEGQSLLELSSKQHHISQSTKPLELHFKVNQIEK